VLKSRLIPCLLLKDGLLVRSERFSIHQAIGDPLHEVRRFNQWMVDELIYLDISTSDRFTTGRTDQKASGLTSTLDVLEAVSQHCFIPLTFGGRIRSLDDMLQRFRRGADKIAINTQAVLTPDLVRAAAQQFGSQAVVVSIDVRKVDGRDEVHIERGRRATGLDPVTWARQVEQLGAGEILLNSVDRDGTGDGYDVDLLAGVADAVRIPVIALGGVGTYEDFASGITRGRASAVSAANIFHFKELSDRNAKRAMKRAGIHVRL
jgi:cyclase